MPIRTLSQLITDLEASLTAETTRVGDLLETFHERGFGFFLLLFALPMSLPVFKPPGMSTLFGVPLLWLTGQQILGFHTVWFPETLQNRTISRQTLQGVIRACKPALPFLGRVLRPRLQFVTSGIASRLIGLCGFLMAASVSLPVPFGNTVPSWGIVLMALGVMSRDGLMVIIGAIVGIVWMIGLYGLLIAFGVEGIKIGLQEMRGLF